MKKSFLFLFATLFLLYSCKAQENLTDKLKKPIAELPKVKPSEVGFNQDSVDHILKLISEIRVPDFRGIVVLKDNEIVVEEYYNTYWRNTIHDIRSAGKSITALLMGIAIDKGYVKDVEQSVYSFFPNVELKNKPTEEHLNIKIKHLLMMSSGLDADTYNMDSPGNGIHWLAENNWVEYALNLPMTFESGEKWMYNDICAMLTGAIVQEASGKNLSEFAKEHLFDPLGIKEYYWYTGPNNRTGAMGNLYISTLDFAKIGSVILNKGKWNGRQIISEKWINEIFEKKLDISNVDPFADYYSYMWYVAEKEINDKKYEYIYASGNGGNKLFIVPEEKLVISILQSAYGAGPGHGRAEAIIEAFFKALD